MNSMLHRWLAFPSWLRALLLISLLAAGGLLVRQFWQRPLQQQIQQLTQRHAQEKKRNRALLRQLRQRSSLREIAAQIARLQQALQPEAPRPFSLLRLAEAAGGDLQSWRPTPQGGELTLMLDWPRLQAVFLYLSERQPPVSLPQFTLQRAGERLLLKLVVRDEN